MCRNNVTMFINSNGLFMHVNVKLVVLPHIVIIMHGALHNRVCICQFRPHHAHWFNILYIPYIDGFCLL